MTVVLDTNVLISGIFWSGSPNKILKLWQEGRFKLAVSLAIIEEYRRITQELRRKYPALPVIDGIIDQIAFNSEIFSVEPPKGPICRDPDDDKFLICALAAKAKYIVTGDKALLELDGFGGIKIIQPSPFLRAMS